MKVSAEEDLAAVRSANEGFYSALSSLDVEQMDRVWHHDEMTRCIHPGWEQIEGWEVIRQSWQIIFSNTEKLQVEAMEVNVRLVGDMAWVSCLESITSGDDEDVTLARATNLFVRTEDGWRMVLHHASQIPAEAVGGSPPATEDPTVH